MNEWKWFAPPEFGNEYLQFIRTWYSSVVRRFPVSRIVFCLEAPRLAPGRGRVSILTPLQGITQMARVRSTVRFSCSLALLTGVGWLAVQDWSAVQNSPAEGMAISQPPEASILNIDWTFDTEACAFRLQGGDGHYGSRLVYWERQELAPRQVSAGQSPILRTAISPNGSFLLAHDEAGAIWRIDPRTGAVDTLAQFPPRTPLTTIAISPDCQLVALGIEQYVLLCDAQTGQELRKIELSESAAAVCDLAFSSDAARLALGCTDGSVRIWSLPSGEFEPPLNDHLGPIAKVRFLEGLPQLLSLGGDDDSLRLWDLESGAVLWRTETGHRRPQALAVSADGEMVATGGQDTQVVLWDLPGRQRLRTLSGHNFPVVALRFGTDDALLLSAAMDGTIAVWEEGRFLSRMVNVGKMHLARD